VRRLKERHGAWLLLATLGLSRTFSCNTKLGGTASPPSRPTETAGALAARPSWATRPASALSTKQLIGTEHGAPGKKPRYWPASCRSVPRASRPLLLSESSRQWTFEAASLPVLCGVSLMWQPENLGIMGISARRCYGATLCARKPLKSLEFRSARAQEPSLSTARGLAVTGAFEPLGSFVRFRRVRWSLEDRAR
jgi:hypothetical protein